jgi:inosine-uridine nucleoside N-ribohydrolase
VGIPVILDTDIGFDVDDVWALAFLLRCPELDVKLVLSDSGDTHYSAALIAKLLELDGRTDVPVGVGIPLDETPRTHARWLGDYSLDRYPGRVEEDGVGALIATISDSHDPVSVICIGPLPNIAAALQRDHSIVDNSRFIGMHGSLRKGYLGSPKPHVEYNVKKHTLSAREVFASAWDKTITPLDTCGTVFLEGDHFAKVKASSDPLARAVLENHDIWFEEMPIPGLDKIDKRRQSSILYDTVAVYLAFGEDLLEMETLPIHVGRDARTTIDEARGLPVRCAMDWADKPAFLDLLSDRLAGGRAD